jgi:hypothetical protein
MRSVVVFEHLTLDGVMQAPGRVAEDRRDGFEHDGWATLWDRIIAGVAPGSGRRLFDTGARPALRLVDAKAAPRGAVIATYQESG